MSELHKKRDIGPPLDLSTRTESKSLAEANVEPGSTIFVVISPVLGLHFSTNNHFSDPLKVFDGTNPSAKSIKKPVVLLSVGCFARVWAQPYSLSGARRKKNNEVYRTTQGKEAENKQNKKATKMKQSTKTKQVRKR